MSRKRSTAARYAVAVAAVAVAIVLDSVPERLGDRKTLLLLNGAVIVAGWYGGRGPAVLALAFAVAAAWFFAVPPFGSFALPPGAAAQLGLFVIEACVCAALTVALTESRASAEQTAGRCQQSEAQLRRLVQAHRALSVTSEALVHSEDEDVLLEEICRAIVEVAGYRMCWVGRAERDEHKTVRPIARAGCDDGYVDRAEVSWADTERGRGPVGTAIRTGRPCVPQDVDDEAFIPWRADALAHGYASVIALPLRLDGQVFGALAIYAAEKDAFDPDAVDLLATLSKDLAYGIGALRARTCAAAESARFESTVMLAPVAVMVCSGPDHVVRLANRRWFALGHDLEDIGRPLRDILPEAAAAGALRVLDEAYQTGEPRETTAQAIPRARRGSGIETRFYNVACQPLACPLGVVCDLIVAVSDVTEQVTARRAIEEARVAAEQASRAKDEFLRIASHELRAPLTPILGWADLLQKNPRGDPEALERGLDAILSNARVMVRVVDDLIDLSQIVAGRMRMEVEPVALGPLSRTCVEEARAAASAKDIRIEVQAAPDTMLWGDPARLAQVVRSLLSNAIKFTPRGGSVTVSVTRRDDVLVLRVHDTGSGIPPSELPHLFEAFHTGDASTTRAQGGLGLGLAIVRYVVEAHGGTVRAESDGPGCGATLVVEIPAPVGSTAGARPPLAVAGAAVPGGVVMHGEDGPARGHGD